MSVGDAMWLFSLCVVNLMDTRLLLWRRSVAIGVLGLVWVSMTTSALSYLISLHRRNTIRLMVCLLPFDLTTFGDMYADMRQTVYQELSVLYRSGQIRDRRFDSFLLLLTNIRVLQTRLLAWPATTFWLFSVARMDLY